MAIRATAVEVRKLVKTKPSHDLNPFIAAANQLVDDCCLASGYSEEKLTRIENWLAAHFYCMEYSRRVQEMVSGGTGQTFQSKIDLFLSLSHYGQMAQVLDTAGGLSALNVQASTVRTVRATLKWVGGGEED